MEDKGLSLSQRLADQPELLRKVMDSVTNDIRVAGPGTITKVNSNQTVEVQLNIRERIKNESDVLEWVDLPLLVDVPICMFRAGGYMLTLPHAVGDEVLVIFSDSCIDAWWQSGGVQNQIDRRRHDLSDGFALPITWNQTRNITSYSAAKAQLRNETGTEYVELGASGMKLAFGSNTIEISSSKLKLTFGSFSLELNATGISLIVGTSTIQLTSAGVNVNGAILALAGTATASLTSPATSIGTVTTVDTKPFLAHTHGGVQGGGSNTSGVT